MQLHNATIQPLNCFIQSIPHFCQQTLCRKYFSKKSAQKWAEGKSAFKSDSWIIAALQGQEMKRVQAFHVLPVHNNSSKFIIHSNWGISVLGSRGAWIGKDGRMLTTVRSNKYSPQIPNTNAKYKYKIQAVQQIFSPNIKYQRHMSNTNKKENKWSNKYSPQHLIEQLL